jgi:hypothetical protein
LLADHLPGLGLRRGSADSALFLFCRLSIWRQLLLDLADQFNADLFLVGLNRANSSQPQFCALLHRC